MPKLPVSIEEALSYYSDAFGRLKVAKPYNLFDIRHEYSKEILEMDEVLTAGGAWGDASVLGSVEINTTATAIDTALTDPTISRVKIFEKATESDVTSLIQSFENRIKHYSTIGGVSDTLLITCQKN